MVLNNIDIVLANVKQCHMSCIILSINRMGIPGNLQNSALVIKYSIKMVKSQNSIILSEVHVMHIVICYFLTMFMFYAVRGELWTTVVELLQWEQLEVLCFKA